MPVRELVDGYATGLPATCGCALDVQLRRLHPHLGGPPPPGAGCAGCGRSSTAGGTSTSATTRGCTASAASSSTPRTSWWTGAALTTARSRRSVEEENYFFRLSRYAEPLPAPAGLRPAAHHPRVARATRCWRLRRPGAAGLQHLPQPGAGPGVGDRGARRPRAGDVRLVRRPGQLHHRPGLRRAVRPAGRHRGRRGRRPLPALLGRSERRRGCTSSARASCASTPSTGRRCSSPPASPCRTPSSSTAT